VTKLSTERELETDSVNETEFLGVGPGGTVVPKEVEAAEVDRFPGRINFSSAPTAAGDIFVRGWDIETDAAASIASGVPFVASEAGYSSRFAFTLSSVVGAPFTMQLTGDTVDPITGVVTTSDTDDIAVTGDGSYQSEKWFVDAPSIVPTTAGKSATALIRKLNYAYAVGRDYEILSLFCEFTPDSVSWLLDLYLWMVEDDGTITEIEAIHFANTDTPPRAENDVPGAAWALDLSTMIDRTKKEGAILYVNQQAVGEISVTVGYEFINPIAP
jgi:hypothetical protein